MLNRKTAQRATKGDQVFSVVNMVFLVLVFLLVAYPVLYIVSASFSSPQAVVSGKVWLLPVDFTLNGYTAALRDPALMNSFKNSIIITVAGTAFNLIVTVMMAYPLSRKNFYGRGFFTGLITVTMFFSGGLVPTFLLINQLNLYNTYLALILPGAVGVTNVIIARTFFQTNIPEELYEAAQLDGCDDFRYFAKVILPLSAPVLAILVLYYGVGHWNAYFNAMIYLRDQDKYPMQMVLREILIKNQISESMMADADAMTRSQGLADLLKYSTIVISSLPMLILYPFIQKHFVKGVMIGAIKG